MGRVHAASHAHTQKSQPANPRTIVRRIRVVANAVCVAREALSPSRAFARREKIITKRAKRARHCRTPTAEDDERARGVFDVRGSARGGGARG